MLWTINLIKFKQPQKLVYVNDPNLNDFMSLIKKKQNKTHTHTIRQIVWLSGEFVKTWGGVLGLKR